MGKICAMKQQEEKDRIQTFFNQPSGRKLFRIRGGDASSLYLGVLGNPEGHITLFHVSRRYCLF